MGTQYLGALPYTEKRDRRNSMFDTAQNAIGLFQKRKDEDEIRKAQLLAAQMARNPNPEEVRKELETIATQYPRLAQRVYESLGPAVERETKMRQANEVHRILGDPNVDEATKRNIQYHWATGANMPAQLGEMTAGTLGTPEAKTAYGYKTGAAVSPLETYKQTQQTERAEDTARIRAEASEEAARIRAEATEEAARIRAAASRDTATTRASGKPAPEEKKREKTVSDIQKEIAANNKKIEANGIEFAKESNPSAKTALQEQNRRIIARNQQLRTRLDQLAGNATGNVPRTEIPPNVPMSSDGKWWFDGTKWQPTGR